MHTSIERVFFVSLFISILIIAATGVLLVLRSTGKDSSVPLEVLNLREQRRNVECEKEICNQELEKVQSVHNHSKDEDKILQTEDLDTMTKLGTDAKLECINEGSCSGRLSREQGLPKATASNQPPALDPSYRDTMVKLGTDLNFDIRQCPTGSYMLNRSLHHPPKHSNCPTLYIVGARKGGTTSLYQYISKHPNFLGIKLDAGPKVGEALYFQRPKMGSWKHYKSLFPTTTRNTTMTGESSVSYLVEALVPKRLQSMCGKQARVVMLLRDPAKRLESNFLMRVKYHAAKFRKRPITALVNDELNTYFKAAKETGSTPTEWSKLVGLFHPARNMVFEGLYYIHLLNWLCNFPAENILIINSEEFFKTPSRILDIVFQFLGLKRLNPETYGSITSATYNRGSYNVPNYQKLSNEDVKNLLKVYKPFNQALLELLRWEDHQWRSS